MDTAHSNTRCPVYLHPAAASNPHHVRRIQQATGQLIVLVGKRPTLQHSTPNTDDLGPFGGDAA